MLVTNEEARKFDEELRQIKWNVVAVDECHKLRNSSSKLFDKLVRVESDFKILLSATPIIHDLNEIWNLFKFTHWRRINPALLSFVFTKDANLAGLLQQVCWLKFLMKKKQKIILRIHNEGCR